MSFELLTHFLDHLFQNMRLRFRQIVLFEGVTGEIEQLNVAVALDAFLFRVLIWKRVEDGFPVAAAPNGEVVAAMHTVWIVHQELLWVRAIGLSRQQRLQGQAVNGMTSGYISFCQLYKCWKDIGHVGDLSLNGVRRNWELLLKCVRGISFRPGSNERHAHAAFVVGAFLTA